MFFRPAGNTEKTIIIKSSDASSDFTNEAPQFVLEQLLELIRLISLKYGFETILGRFNTQSPEKVDLIFQNIDIETPNDQPYLLMIVKEKNFRELKTPRLIELIQKDDGTYQLHGFKDNKWQLTQLEPSEVLKFDSTLENVEPDTPLSNYLKIGHDSTEMSMVPEWKTAVKFLSSFGNHEVKTGFDHSRFGRSFTVPYYACLTIDTAKMKDAITGLNLFITPTEEQVKEQHNARRHAAC